MSQDKKRNRRRLGRRWARFGEGAKNAAEWLREGRLGAPYRADSEEILAHQDFTLRRYLFGPTRKPQTGPPLLLVPPLMVTAEVYDISPELSAVALLLAQGFDVWVTDYGRPEVVEGGMERTLDAHVLAVDQSITEIASKTTRKVHLVGYSQGGMFAYQAAAYRDSRDVASVITFGSPVDIHRSLTRVKDSLTEKFVQTARRALAGPLKSIEGLPGTLTSRGFKLLSPRQEIKQMIGMLGLLHDREALKAQEPKRRFLGGEGFVAWPGPALRRFVDDLIVDNRMKQGGLVIGGRTLALNQITCPILYFYGARDDMARPAAVKAIEQVAPRSETTGVKVEAGHFGLVVGSRAMSDTWPLTCDWIRWQEGEAGRPNFSLETPQKTRPRPSTNLLYELATDVIDGLWQGMGDASSDVSALIESLRWQLPRLARIESLKPTSRVSMARALAEQARAIGDRTFFIWKGRAFSYAQANERVDQMVKALYSLGIRRGHHVGVLMGNRPGYLTTVAATSRLGAVSVHLHSGLRGHSLDHALAAGEIDFLIADVEHSEAALQAFPGTIGLVGRHDEELPARLVRLSDRFDQPLPEDFKADDGRAEDLAMLMFTSGTTGLPKAARITNQRWATAALASAAACQLTPRDTAYCCLPLHHATGQLVGVGGALVGGARLALAAHFSTTTFWDEVQRNGVTVVFYVGELCRYLVNAPASEQDQNHTVRLFTGNGLRPDVWRKLKRRFAPKQILEFYAATEGNILLANLTGDKEGSVGRSVSALGTTDLALIRYDIPNDTFARDEQGFMVRVDPDEPGLLIARISATHPLSRFDGYMDDDDTERKVLRNVFETGDAWFNSGDLLRSDEDGDYWFVDRLGDTFRWKGENVSTEQVAAVLHGCPEIDEVAVYGIALPGREGRAGMAAITLATGASFDPEGLFQTVSENLSTHARPIFVRVVETMDHTSSFKVRKAALREEGADPGRIQDPVYWLNDEERTYTRVDMDVYFKLVEA